MVFGVGAPNGAVVGEVEVAVGVWANAEADGGCPKAEGALLVTLKGDACPNADPDVEPKALGLAKAELELVVPNADCAGCAPPPEPLNADCPKTDPEVVVGLVVPAVANADGPGPAKAENPPLFAAAPPKGGLAMEGWPKEGDWPKAEAPNAGAPKAELPGCWPNADVEPGLWAPKAEGCPAGNAVAAPDADAVPETGNADVLFGVSAPRLCLFAASKALFMSLRTFAKICSAFAKTFCSC